MIELQKDNIHRQFTDSENQSHHPPKMEYDSDYRRVMYMCAGKMRNRYLFSYSPKK